MNELTSIEHWNQYSANHGGIIADENTFQVKVFKHLIGGATKDLNVLEIGFAPGSFLAFLSKKFQCRITGIDYSPVGVDMAKKMFSSLNIEGDLRCEDIFKATLPSNHFDVVCSFGVIEHFADPLPIISRHVEFCKPGGKIIITVPNHRAFFNRLPFLYDKKNYHTHNYEIMQCSKLLSLTSALNLDASAVPFGGFSMIGCGRLNKKIPRVIRSVLCRNEFLLKPLNKINTEAFSPHLVLIVEK
jgi:2-polyprenyl-3-methyl-5-hydroxy-6-metoxy-1,4-benzoquinol methylase